MSELAGKKQMVEALSEELQQERLDDVVEEAHASKSRSRKATLLKLQWLAERLRKVERIRKQIENGSYQVDSEDVARSLLNLK